MSNIKENIVIFILPFSLSILSVILALYILPINCTLFVSNSPGPQTCHTIELTKDGKFIPNNCLEGYCRCLEGYCRDLSSEKAATLIFSFGILLFFLPPTLKIFSEFQSKEIEQIKLSD